jgi:hypothetical protein
MKIPYYKNIMFLDQDTPVILQFRIGTRDFTDEIWAKD